MRVLLIDQLANENKYRNEFWTDNNKSFNNLQIEIPNAIDGNIVKKILTGGGFEKIELQDFDLVIIHERDDRNTGYEGTAKKLKKNLIVYSDAFDDIPIYDENLKLLKVKGYYLYSHLRDFLVKMDHDEIIDFNIICQFDEKLEELLEPFANISPFSNLSYIILDKEEKPYKDKEGNELTIEKARQELDTYVQTNLNVKA